MVGNPLQNMKKLFVLAALITQFAACSSDIDFNPEENGNSVLPSLPALEDVCSGMDCDVFMQYCYANFDGDKDGMVSLAEAEAVREIDLSDSEVTSLTGIGYFTNLERLTCLHCEQLCSVDLRYNRKLATIQEGAFARCGNLQRVAIPESVTAIGADAFSDCSSLQSVVVPESVVAIGAYAFLGCTSLQAVTIPEGVTVIEAFTFKGCTSLQKVTIPKGVTVIKGYAFYECTNLQSIYCKPINPPSLKTDFAWLNFDKNASGRKIYVPAGSVDAYKSATGWSSYAADIVAEK